MSELANARRKTWIKICGVTNIVDAQAAVEAGADAVGFVFAASPRRVTPLIAAEICAQLPEHVERVGVFVHEPVELIREVMDHARLNAAQIHVVARGADGRPTLETLLREARNAWAAISASQDDGSMAWLAMDQTLPKEHWRVFVDSGTATRPGGTGEVFDWEIAAPFVEFLQQRVPVVIAGGLRPENVAAAIARFAPFGVDVSSGVESVAGKKDHQKIRDFIVAVRAADESANGKRVIEALEARQR